ncbi:hypothetical protein GCM10010234_05640 [Streptomyces hawaiiensis]|uniref:hypothetical protein n=1 Tax=Streptomyces hawaiiensis TaxID=67305 RepID=UPI0031E018EC
MSPKDEAGVYEIRIHGCTNTEEALALQAPIERLLCPNPDHAPPCEIPWSFSLSGEEADSTALVLGVYTPGDQATQVAERVRTLVGEQHRVAVSEGEAEDWEELVEQYRFERGLGSERDGPEQ